MSTFYRIPCLVDMNPVWYKIPVHSVSKTVYFNVSLWDSRAVAGMEQNYENN